MTVINLYCFRIFQFKLILIRQMKMERLCRTVIDCIDLGNSRSKIAIFFHWRDFNKIKQTTRLVLYFFSYICDHMILFQSHGQCL